MSKVIRIPDSDEKQSLYEEATAKLRGLLDGEADLADPTLFDWGVSPGEVGELRVDRNADDLDAALFELVHTTVMRD